MTDRSARPDAPKLDGDQEDRHPMQYDACSVEPVILRVDPNSCFIFRFGECRHVDRLRWDSMPTRLRAVKFYSRRKPFPTIRTPSQHCAGHVRWDSHSSGQSSNSCEESGDGHLAEPKPPHATLSLLRRPPETRPLEGIRQRPARSIGAAAGALGDIALGGNAFGSRRTGRLTADFVVETKR